MTEEEYAKFANERRQKYGGFVVGDEGDECVPARPDGFQIPTLPRGRPTAAQSGLKSRSARFRLLRDAAASRNRIKRIGRTRIPSDPKEPTRHRTSADICSPRHA
jgi:hypothetical protein